MFKTEHKSSRAVLTDFGLSFLVTPSPSSTAAATSAASGGHGGGGSWLQSARGTVGSLSVFLFIYLSIYLFIYLFIYIYILKLLVNTNKLER